MTENHPNLQRIIDALTANPEPLITWAAHEAVSLGAKLDWDSEDNYACTEGLCDIIGGRYGLPNPGNASAEGSLRFYGEAAIALGWDSHYAPAANGEDY